MYHLKVSQLQLAIEHLEKACKEYKDLGENDAELHYHLGLAYSKKDFYLLSNDYVENAIQLYQKNLHFQKILLCNLLLSINYKLMGDLERAEEVLIKIVQSQLGQKDKEILAKSYHNLGLVKKEQLKYKEAIDYLDRSLKFKHEKKDVLITLLLKAKVFSMNNERDKAIKLINEGQSLAKSANNQKFIYKFCVLNHQLEGSLMSKEFLHKLESEIVPYFKDIGRSSDYIEFLELLADQLFSASQYKKAAMYFNKLYKISKTSEIH
jgi:HTH-type transcriptional regulator, quorum sensing regulator NprR